MNYRPSEMSDKCTRSPFAITPYFPIITTLLNPLWAINTVVCRALKAYKYANTAYPEKKPLHAIKYLDAPHRIVTGYVNNGHTCIYMCTLQWIFVRLMLFWFPFHALNKSLLYFLQALYPPAYILSLQLCHFSSAELTSSSPLLMQQGYMGLCKTQTSNKLQIKRKLHYCHQYHNVTCTVLALYNDLSLLKIISDS